MAILSTKMLAALQAAKTAGALGLRQTAAGWVEASKPDVYHAAPTISALVERGDISKERGIRVEGARAFITQRGGKSLAEAQRAAS